MCDAGAVNEHRIRFEGAATSAVGVATAIADADGVDLTSSESPVVVDGDRVRLDLVVEGPRDVIAAAVDEIRAGLPDGSSLSLDPS